MSTPVKRGASSEDAYQRLRSLIIEGVYQPGDRLSHPQVMRMLNTGRTPLREALSRLQSDGLVVMSANRGATVAPVDLGSSEEIYVLRLLLEPPLLQAGVPQMGREQLRRMRDLLSRMEESAGEPALFARAHREFHSAQRAHYTGRFIDEVVMHMYRHIHRHEQHFYARATDPADFVELDRAMLAAITDGDARRARQAFEFHLADAALSLLLGEDPDNPLALLAPVMVAAGMCPDISPQGRIERPIAVSWSAPAAGLPAFSTANLRHQPRIGSDL